MIVATHDYYILNMIFSILRRLARVCSEFVILFPWIVSDAADRGDNDGHCDK